MFNLDVISINLWSVLSALANLLLLFLLFKYFLFKPVRKALRQRQEALERSYEDARLAKEEAEKDRAVIKADLDAAKDKADELVAQAQKRAELRSEKIVSDAHEKAEGIVKEAQVEAQLEHKKAEAEIRQRIVDVSTVLTEKMIGRELSETDHHEVIAQVLDEIGENHDANS